MMACPTLCASAATSALQKKASKPRRLCAAQGGRLQHGVSWQLGLGLFWIRCFISPILYLSHCVNGEF